jgi:hypothetical protein
MFNRFTLESLKDAGVPALPSVLTYLTGFRGNQKSQVCDFVSFQSNCFHSVNSLFIEIECHLVVTT